MVLAGAGAPPDALATAPGVTPSIIGLAGDGGWYRSPVTVRWDVGTEGLVNTTGCDATVTTATSGGGGPAFCGAREQPAAITIQTTLLRVSQFIFRLPSAAERFVQRDQIRRHGAFTVHELIFGLIQRTLGVEHVEKIAEPFRIKFVRQFQRASIRRHRFVERAIPDVLVRVSDQRVLDVFERSQYDLFVRCKRLLLPGIRRLKYTREKFL